MPLTNTSKITDESVTFSLDVADSHYNYQWYKGGTPIEGATSNTYSLPMVKIADAGVYKCQIWNGCNEVYSTVTILTVDKALQTITFNELPKKTYGDPTFSLLASVTSNQSITFESSNTNVATVSGNIVTIHNAGAAYITASVASNDNYYAANPVQQLLTVNKAFQTVALDFVPNKTYGDVAFTLSAQTSTGLPVTYISSDPTKLAISGNQATIAGTGNFTVTAQQAGNNNYLPISDSKSFAVSKANLTISAENKERYYGDENPAFTYTFNGFVNGDTREAIQTLPTIVCPATQTSPIGNYVITASGAADDNYNFIYQNALLTINKTTLKIQPNDVSRKYGENNPVFTLTYSGFKNDENESVLDILPTINCSATKNSPAGLYEILLSGGSDNNYDYNLLNGKLEITTVSSLARINTSNLSLYPNPVKNDLFIQSETPVEKIEIYDQSGICVLVNENVIEKVDVSGLANGLYLVRIFVEKTPVIEKIVIRK